MSDRFTRICDDWKQILRVDRTRLNSCGPRWTHQLRVGVAGVAQLERPRWWDCAIRMRGVGREQASPEARFPLQKCRPERGLVALGRLEAAPACGLDRLPKERWGKLRASFREGALHRVLNEFS